jgi:hypothetical protein
LCTQLLAALATVGINDAVLMTGGLTAQMRKKLYVLAGLVAMAVAYAPPASADMLLTLSSGTNSVTLSDGGSGFVNFSGPLGAWIINVTTGIQLGATVLDLNSVDVTIGGATPLVITLSGNNMSAPGGAAGLLASIGGTVSPGFSLTYAAYFDANNTLGGLGTQFGNTLSFGPIAFSGSTTGSVVTDKLFALNQVITLAGQGTGATSFNSEIRVPDGGVTLVLLGGVLVGLETLRRKLGA